MKVSTLLKFAAPALLLIAGTVNAATIVGSSHDLSAQNATTAQVCVFCHTPHKALTGLAAPLWNRTASAAAYTMYGSDTIDMTIQSAPEGTSLACLSCHDGTVALDSLINPPPGFSAGAGTIGANGDLGNDLSNDHPISIVYDSTQDTGFVATATVALALPLFTGTGANQLECATCHNVHDPANAPFLRITNAASALCVTCHIK